MCKQSTLQYIAFRYATLIQCIVQAMANDTSYKIHSPEQLCLCMTHCAVKLSNDRSQAAHGVPLGYPMPVPCLCVATQNTDVDSMHHASSMCHR